jgi:hypothetical protein
MVRQLRDRFLVPQERLEDIREDAEQWVGPAGLGQSERRRTDRLGVGAVDDRPDVATDEPDAVARTEERVVAIHDLVQQPGELGLGADLGGRLLVLRVADRVGAPAEDHARVPIQVDLTQRVALDSPAFEIAFVQPAETEERGVLVVGGQVLGARREQQERLHGETVPA